MKDIQPTKAFLISDLETLKIVANPLRIQIIESLVPQPLTVAQVAERLGLAPSKLYYHVNLLEQHGLIKVVEERVVSNIIEKVYRAVAEELDVESSLLSFATREGTERVRSVFAATIDATRDDILRSFKAGAFALEQGKERRPRKALLDRTKSRVSEAQAEEFHRRLKALLSEFEAADAAESQSEDLQAYALSVVFYPSHYYPDAEEAE